MSTWQQIVYSLGLNVINGATQAVVIVCVVRFVLERYMPKRKKEKKDDAED